MRAIAQGEPVRRYNQIIGFASKPIAAGEHVHTHNLEWAGQGRLRARLRLRRRREAGAGARAGHASWASSAADGRVATRNYIGILSSVNCSATAARAIADHFSRQTNPAALADYPNVDGVVALTHGTGCGMDTEGMGMQILRAHARRLCHACQLRGACWWSGLGCEANQINAWLAPSSLREGEHSRSSTSRTPAARARRWRRASR